MQSTEIWKPVPGYEGAYDVSSLGQVRSVDRIIQRRDGVSQALRGLILRQATVGEGYLAVNLTVNGKGRTRKVHQLVLEAFVGARPAGLIGCHGNGCPADNRLENLRWDTHAENNRDTIRHGRNPRTNKTHCPRGHPLDIPANIQPSVARAGHRDCLACTRARAHARWNRTEFSETLADQYFAEILAGPTEKPHCVNGHALTPENTYRPSDGHPRCRECRNEASRRQTERRKTTRGDER